MIVAPCSIRSMSEIATGVTTTLLTGQRTSPSRAMLDPSSNRGISAKMGFDATKPIRTEPFAFKRIHVKGVENINLDNVLQQDAKTAFAQIIAR
jgi:3-polyprenyl-4-hydroxybenzoate decarboxylase